MSSPALRQLRKVRRTCYSTARFLGDVNAVASGRVPQRIVRKVVYRSTGREVARVLRALGI